MASVNYFLINEMKNLSPQVVEYTIYHNICQESSWYADLGLYDYE